MKYVEMVLTIRDTHVTTAMTMKTMDVHQLVQLMQVGLALEVQNLQQTSVPKPVVTAETMPIGMMTLLAMMETMMPVMVVTLLVTLKVAMTALTVTMIALITVMKLVEME